MAYDGNFAHLTGTSGFIQIGFINGSITGSLNTPSASYRTDTLVSALGITVDITHDIETITFLTGFQGVSNDFYAINITSDLQDANNIDVFVTAHPQTQVDHLTIYTLTIDRDGLAVASWTFTQNDNCYSYYGEQMTFFTPETNSFFDDNFIAGLNSFTIRDDI